VGPVGADDAEIMAYAAQHDYIVLSQDLDFSTILAATSGTKPSVVQLRSDNLDPDVIGSSVIAALRQLENELQSGAIVSIDPQRTRIRLLPLPPKD
jgi:predicted nuclease of predicted toxin-antitoxin system